MIFVNPYEGDLALIGTTDIPFEGQAEDVRVDARMLKDDRVEAKEGRTIWDGDEEKLG